MKIDQLKKLGIFTQSEAKKLGISHMTLSRGVKDGKLERLARGFYKHPDVQLEPQEEEFALACKKFGNDAFIGGLTALSYWGLLEQSVEQIWMMVPPSIRTQDPLYRCIRSKSPSNIGIEEFSYYRIANIERSIVESMHYASKLGPTTGINAARVAIKEKKTDLKSLVEMAKNLNCEDSLNRCWSAITAI